VVDRSELNRILAGVKRDGYCISDQEAFIGDISTAAPVFDERGEVVAAVNIAVPFPRWSVGSVEARLTPIVIDCARQITAKLTERN
jgi:DNA-binding IclR family transcriptional regulator